MLFGTAKQKLRILNLISLEDRYSLVSLFYSFSFSDVVKSLHGDPYGCGGHASMQVHFHLFNNLNVSSLLIKSDCSLEFHLLFICAPNLSLSVLWG